MKGTIKALRISFGFIKVENEEKDLFFHQTDVVGGEAEFKNLREGDAVEFEKGSGDKGPKAVKVKKAGTGDAPVDKEIGDIKPKAKKV